MGSLFLLFLAGGIAGASAALLLAPQSGRATRGRMRQKLQEGGEYARRLRDRTWHQGDGLRERAAKRLKKAAEAIAPRDGHSEAASA
jgi:gas vesicle protein